MRCGRRPPAPVLGAGRNTRFTDPFAWKMAWGFFFHVAMTFLSGGLAGYYASDSDIVKVTDLEGVSSQAVPVYETFLLQIRKMK